jgi:hypothetical protein
MARIMIHRVRLTKLVSNSSVEWYDGAYEETNRLAFETSTIGTYHGAALARTAYGRTQAACKQDPGCKYRGALVVLESKILDSDKEYEIDMDKWIREDSYFLKPESDYLNEKWECWKHQ